MTDKKQARVTDKKQARVTEEKKCCGMTGREKTLCCDRKRGIRRSLDVFLRKRGMTLI